MTDKTKAALKGHKFQRVRYTAQTICECGWESGHWCGKGARANAYGEWYMHIENCKKVA